MNDSKINEDELFNSDSDVEIRDFTVEEGSAKERIDKYITEMWGEEVSRSQVQIWITGEHVKVNGNTVKANYKLSVGDRIEVIVPEPITVEIIAQDIPLEVAYEDHDLIVVNKPRGMVVHPAPGHSSGTLVNALMYHCKDLSGINGELRPGIVHRIDKDTSGLIMAAKNDKSHAALAGQLKEHTVTRRYIALVHGSVAHDQGTVDAPIGRDPMDRKMYTVKENNSKNAVTHFTVKERLGDYTLVELKLETGRTHQIRVHMKFIGHPLVGDPIYGRGKGIKFAGQALHAAVLGFVHPSSGEYMEFNAEIPPDLQDLIASLRSR